MTYRTMEEWNAKGRMVERGQKCLIRSPLDNSCLFHKSQTKKYKRRGMGVDDYSDYGDYGSEYPDWGELDSCVMGQY